MQDFEKLGAFYLGRLYDQDQRTLKDDLLLYDSKDLVTHAVCVGMTGSGKTGLCLGLIEEAAIDGIPAIIIDPKGDLSNLLLTFPNLRPEDFLPWINEEDARNKGLTPADFAAQQAAMWSKGLADWGENGARIQRLRDSADIAVYTPGSDAGIPVSVLKSFTAPAAAVRDDRELFRDRISATVTSLLGLCGIDADPIQSREHILLSTLFDLAWRKGSELDLATIIQQVQTPPVSKVGVMDLDTFYPAKERFGLAMALNHLVASPDFQAWLEGEPLDIERLLHTGDGKPRVSIFSISHLSDAERMFFVSLLLNQMVSWVRTQSGTTSLRALLYMDEIFGYFPPVANPPSKKPLLTLLKQARAFGLGVVLATQNPVDLDYKGLGNTGTWFIGRLQTDRDKMRVLDGLEGAAGENGSKFDRQAMERILAGLGSRVFLMNNTHEDRPVVFQTRWTLSYLRGPLARPQIKALMDGRRDGSPQVGQAYSPAAQATDGAQSSRPVLAPDITQYFLPVRGAATAVVYRPMLIGAGQVHFIDAATGADTPRNVMYLTSISADAVAVNWDENTKALDLTPEDLESEPAEGARYVELPPAAAKSKNYAAWSKEFSSWLFRMEKLDIFHCAELDAFSNPGESERDFRVRLQQAAREERDKLKDDLQKSYQPKFDALNERKRRAEQAMEREQQQSQSQTVQTAIAVGATVFGALFGRKTISVATIGRAATAARAVNRARKESQDIDRAGENAGAIDQQIQALNDQFQQDLASSASKVGAATVALETKTVRPKKTNITVRLVSLAWNPEA